MSALAAVFAPSPVVLSEQKSVSKVEGSSLGFGLLSDRQKPHLVLECHYQWHSESEVSV